MGFKTHVNACLLYAMVLHMHPLTSMVTVECSPSEIWTPQEKRVNHYMISCMNTTGWDNPTPTPAQIIKHGNTFTPIQADVEVSINLLTTPSTSFVARRVALMYLHGTPAME